MMNPNEVIDVRNLSPHDIYFLNKDNERVGMIPEPDKALRLDEGKKVHGNPTLRVFCPKCEGDGCSECGGNGKTLIQSEENAKHFSAESDLPPKVDGRVYVVSSIVADKIDRDDFRVPDVVRDSDNRVIGCVALSIIE